MDKLADFAHTHLTEAALSRPQRFVDTLLTIVSRSSMVSRFEKPPFREFLDGLDSKDKRRLTEAFGKRLFGRKKREGFAEIVDLLARYKLARWSLVSAICTSISHPRRRLSSNLRRPERSLPFSTSRSFNTTPRPSWAFYVGYRNLILDIEGEGRLEPNAE